MVHHIGDQGTVLGIYITIVNSFLLRRRLQLQRNLLMDMRPTRIITLSMDTMDNDRKNITCFIAMKSVVNKTFFQTL